MSYENFDSIIIGGGPAGSDIANGQRAVAAGRVVEHHAVAVVVEASFDTVRQGVDRVDQIADRIDAEEAGANRGRDPLAVGDDEAAFVDALASSQ